MNIIFGPDAATTLDDKYVVLELDTILLPGAADPITAYCVVDQVPLTEIVSIERYKDLHHNLMKNYKIKNWNFCRDAIEQLHGHWGGHLNSFYENLLTRVDQYKEVSLPDSWNGVIDKSSV